MARSLLRQLEQVRRAATYNDDVADVNLPGVAEPTVSGSLEEDTNVLRSLFKQLKGTSTWFENLGTYTDPSATTTPKQMTLSGIKGHTLDAKTIILAVANDQGGSGYAVTTASSGVTLSGVTTRYATSADHTGLPIYSAGYFDSNADDRIARVDIVNMDTDSEIQDGSGNTIYGKLWDSALVGAAGEGTDVFVKFYTSAGPCNMVAGVSSIAAVYPQRKRLTDMEEYEWLRTDFISSWEGDVELIEDIQNLWAFTGASDNDIDAGAWLNTGAGYLLQTNPTTLKSAIDLLNDGVGSRQDGNYIQDDQDIAESLVALDSQLHTVSLAIESGVGEKYVESVTTLITKNTSHSLPYSITFTPSTTAGQEGKNMDVYVDGQLLAADTTVSGVPQADRDYEETSGTALTFRFDIQVGRNITYVVRQ